MNLADFGKALLQLSPALGAAIGGPGGLAIGAGIAKLFGGNINDPDDLLTRMQQDPNVTIKIQEFLHEQKIAEINAEVKHHEAEVDDRKSARAAKDSTSRNVVYLIVLGFIASIFTIPYLPIDKGGETQIMLVLMGMLASKFNTVCDYLFGGSTISDEIFKLIGSAFSKKS